MMTFRKLSICLLIFFLSSLYCRAGDTLSFQRYLAVEGGVTYLHLPGELTGLDSRLSSQRFAPAIVLDYGVLCKRHFCLSLGLEYRHLSSNWSTDASYFDPHTPSYSGRETDEYFVRYSDLSASVRLRMLYGDGRWHWGGGIGLAAGGTWSLTEVWAYKITVSRYGNSTYTEEHFGYYNRKAEAAPTGTVSLFAEVSYSLYGNCWLYFSPGLVSWIKGSDFIDQGDLFPDCYAHLGLRIGFSSGGLTFAHEAFRIHPFS